MRYVAFVLGLLLSQSLAAQPMLQARQNFASDSSVVGERRVALVIGNNSYPQAPLKNSVNDAGAIALELKKLGFDVTYAENLDRRGFASRLREFGTKLKDQKAISFIYFAGHGIQY